MPKSLLNKKTGDFEQKDIKGVNDNPVVVDTAEESVPEVKSGDNLQPNKLDSISKLKTVKMGEVLDGGNAGNGGTPVGSEAGRAASYSGNDSAISGSLASTPSVEGNSRSKSRYGKRVDETVRKANDLASEQVVVEVTSPSKLSEGKVQGSNRTNRNDLTVRSKTKGATPASDLFQRSFDEIRIDELVHPHGQILKELGTKYLDRPSKTLIKGLDNAYTEQDTNMSERGNYIPRKLKFTIHNTKGLVDFKFEVDDVTSEEHDSLVLNAAGPHAKIHANKVELERRAIDGIAGDENNPGWSPLPRAIAEPTPTLAYLKDYESDTGNHAYMAARFGQLSLAYQINRLAKDGTQPTVPMLEAFYSLIEGEKDFDGYTGGINGMFDDYDMMKKGSPALLIAMFDSTGKYKTKGDILNFPNSLKSHLFKGITFLDNLKASPQLINYMEKNQTFSTIDGQYDGIKPVFMEDTFLISSPFDWNTQFLAYEGTNGLELKSRFTYGYSDIRANYYTETEHPLIAGIFDWLQRHAANVASAFRLKGNETAEIEIPIAYSLTKLSTWSFIVLAAMADIEKRRLTTFREIQYYEDNHNQTVFGDLTPLKGYPTTSATQFSFDSITEPIKIGTMTANSKQKFLMPELFHNYDEETRGATLVDHRHVLMPWYFTEDSFVANGISTATFDPYAHAVAWPKVRSGLVLEHLADLVERDEREVRLSLDRMIYPVFKQVPYTDFAAYKYDKSTDGLISMVIKQSDFTIKALLTTPRELGIRMVLPGGYATPRVEGHIKLTDTYEFDTSFRLKVYTGNLADGTNKGTVIDNSSINIDRGALYKQEFYYIPATAAGTMRDGGFSMSIRDMIAVDANGIDSHFVENYSVFNPFTKLGTGKDQDAIVSVETRLISLHKNAWVRNQIIPFVVSPYDASGYARKSGEDGQKFDIYDHAYTFGLVGFQSSFFEEDHYNRMDKQIQEGYVFTEDTLLNDTTLL